MSGKTGAESCPFWTDHRKKERFPRTGKSPRHPLYEIVQHLFVRRQLFVRRVQINTRSLFPSVRRGWVDMSRVWTADRDGRKGWHRSLPWTGNRILNSRTDSLRSASAGNRPRGAAAVRTTCHRRSRPKQGPRRRRSGPGPRQSPAQTAMSQAARRQAPVATSGSEWSAASRFRSALSLAPSKRRRAEERKALPIGREDRLEKGRGEDQGEWERWERGAPSQFGESNSQYAEARKMHSVHSLHLLHHLHCKGRAHCFSHSVHSLLPPFPFFFWD